MSSGNYREQYILYVSQRLIIAKLNHDKLKQLGVYTLLRVSSIKQQEYDRIEDD